MRHDYCVAAFLRYYSRFVNRLGDAYRTKSLLDRFFPGRGQGQLGIVALAEAVVLRVLLDMIKVSCADFSKRRLKIVKDDGVA